MNELEIKQKSLERLQQALKSKYSLKGFEKFFKNITVNDIEILPAIKATAKKLSYSGRIFTQLKFDDGRLDKEYLEGDFTLISDSYYYSKEELINLDAAILSSVTGRVCSTFSLEPDHINHNKGKVSLAEAGTNRRIFEELEKEMEKAYRDANYRNLYNYPKKVKVIVFMTRPTSDDKLESHLHPIVAKITSNIGIAMNMVIGIYDEEEQKILNSSGLYSIDSGTYWLPMTPIIYDSNGNLHSWQKNLFGYKIL